MHRAKEHVAELQILMPNPSGITVWFHLEQSQNIFKSYFSFIFFFPAGMPR